jgi:hypothetical protein
MQQLTTHLAFKHWELVYFVKNSRSYLRACPRTSPMGSLPVWRGTVAPISLPPTIFQIVNLERPLHILVVARHIWIFWKVPLSHCSLIVERIKGHYYSLYPILWHMSPVKKLHGLNMERKTLHGMVLVGAHAWAHDLQDYSHTPSGLDIACLECDSWACS